MMYLLQYFIVCFAPITLHQCVATVAQGAVHRQIVLITKLLATHEEHIDRRSIFISNLFRVGDGI